MRLDGTSSNGTNRSAVHLSPQPLHGGPDALGVPLHDFSTNSNACGPCPVVVAALHACDASHYPDPAYTALRQQLAEFHGVATSRIVLAGSASEFIFRITAWVARQGRDDAHSERAHTGASAIDDAASVCVPPHAYGDYAQAARAWGLRLTDRANEAALVWACEPSSPLGRAHASWPGWLMNAAPSESHPPLVLDCAYAPLRLSGAPTLTDTQRHQVWQMWTPNKALGLTGVRGAYVIAPLEANESVAALNRLCPSWPLGAHGVALLQAWVQPEVQAWLADSLQTLRDWKVRQIRLLESLGWICLPSEANFFCAQPPDLPDEPASNAAHNAASHPDLGRALAHLRQHGIKLRDATSFGLPGHVRLGVLSPAAQDMLVLTIKKSQRKPHVRTEFQRQGICL